MFKKLSENFISFWEVISEISSAEKFMPWFSKYQEKGKLKIEMLVNTITVRKLNLILVIGVQ